VIVAGEVVLVGGKFSGLVPKSLKAVGSFFLFLFPRTIDDDAADKRKEQKRG
jgi:hypothetical protein